MSTPVEPHSHSRFALLWPHILIALAAFSVLRIALLVKAWPEVSHTVWNGIYIFTLGLFYDLAFISYFCIPFVLILLLLPDRLFRARPSRYVSYAISLAVFYGLYFSCTAEWLFWEEFGTRFNFISVDYLIYRHEVAQNIYESYPLVAILTALLAAAVLTLASIKRPLAGALKAIEPPRLRFGRAVPFFIAPVLAALLVGQSLRTLSPNNYVNELASNGPYQFVAAFRHNELDYKAFYIQGDDDALSSLLRNRIDPADQDGLDGQLFDIRRQIASAGPPKRMNVMLITVESLSAKYLNRFGSVSGATPFMDAWFQQGLLFTNCFATGTRTTRGLEAITLSIPPTPGRSVVKRPDNAHMFSLGKVLQDNGYDTAFIYGGRGFFDNMNAFFTGNGYRTVDQNDFETGDISFKNAWGVADEDLYRKAIQEADRTHRSGQPFFFHVLTTSNHRPYTYPEGKIDIAPGSGRQGAVKYTDYALSVFMDLARTKPWYTDTLFVLVADHCAGSAGKVGLDQTKYHIPLFFFSPGRVAAGENDRRCSQIDTAPTVLSFLNIDYESQFFGTDMLTSDFRPRALIANYQKLGFLQDNDHLAILSPGKKIELQIEDRLTPLDAASALAQELMAYYQGADYILSHRLNRW